MVGYVGAVVSSHGPFRIEEFGKKGERKGFLHDHLLTGKQRVADELASPQSNGSVGHCGDEW